MAESIFERVRTLLAESDRERAIADGHLARAEELNLEIRRLLDTVDAMGKVAAND